MYRLQDMKGFIITPKGHMWTPCLDKTIGYGAHADTISLARTIALSPSPCSPSASLPKEFPGSLHLLCPLLGYGLSKGHSRQPFSVVVGTEIGKLQPFCLSSFSPVSPVRCFPDLPTTALP